MSWSQTFKGKKADVVAGVLDEKNQPKQYAPLPFVEHLVAAVEAMAEPPDARVIVLYTYGHVNPDGTGERHFIISQE